jgi:hypothetical protein
MVGNPGRGPSGLHVVLEKARRQLFGKNLFNWFPTEPPALLATHWHNVQ